MIGGIADIGDCLSCCTERESRLASAASIVRIEKKAFPCGNGKPARTRIPIPALAKDHKVERHDMAPGKPMQNGDVKPFSG